MSSYELPYLEYQQMVIIEQNQLLDEYEDAMGHAMELLMLLLERGTKDGDGLANLTTQVAFSVLAYAGVEE